MEKAGSDLVSWLLDIFDPQPEFKGTLEPRAADLNGLGTSPIGIPNQNLSVQDITGGGRRGVIQSPGFQPPVKGSYSLAGASR